MRLQTRKLLDRSFTGVSALSVAFMAAALVVLLGPVFWRGMGAFLFYATVEHRKLLTEEFGRGDPEAVRSEAKESARKRAFIYEAVAAYEPQVTAEMKLAGNLFRRGFSKSGGVAPESLAIAGEAVRNAVDAYLASLRGKAEEKRLALGNDGGNELLREDAEELSWASARLEENRAVLLERGKETMLDGMDALSAAKIEGYLFEIEASLTEPLRRLTELKSILRELFGPFPDDGKTVLMRQEYGQMRWDRALVKLENLLFVTRWAKPTPDATTQVKQRIPRRELFANTPVSVIFDRLDEKTLSGILRPRLTCYFGFLLDKSYDEHRFGGIWPEVLGTLALTVGAMLFAIPMGIIAAIYLAEYARDTWFVGLLRSCISTLAGVPSIVFGLFGLAFFVDTIGLHAPKSSRSLLAGSLTLALLVLPTIIRAAEAAIHSVPHAYKEAAMGLGATRWRTVVTVILPAALPGILTGIVISMGRAAGETAPIIFTAAVSLGDALPFSLDALYHATPALPWNIYNLCSENNSVNEIAHVQYGMVLTLVALVLALNIAAIYLRARIQNKMRG